MTRRRVAAAVISTIAMAATALAATVPPAGATVPTDILHDRVGDVAFPHGDIVDAGAGTDASGYAFSVHVRAPVNPHTDPNWRNGSTQIQWFLDADLNGVPDEVAMLDADGAGGLHAVMERYSDQQVLCSGSGSYTARHDYVATFPVGCIRGIVHFRWSATMTYANDNPNDTVPELSFSSVLHLGRVGYWMLGLDGHVYGFGGPRDIDAHTTFAMAITPRLDGSGVWFVNAAGRVFATGTARNFGDDPKLAPGEVVTTISATPTGLGYWLFSNTGRVFPYGDARSYGDLHAARLNGPIVASTATPTGLGYYMVGSDGGVFAFGDAKFRGSMGGVRLNRPVVGIAPTPDNSGYWLVASDGGVFAFSAPFRGSLGNVQLNEPVNGLVAYGNGYLMVASDGGVFDFSNRKFLGSLANRTLTAPIVGIAAFTT